MRIRLNQRSVATLVAALRHYQKCSRERTLSPEVTHCAAGSGHLDPLDLDEIDDLCARIAADED